MTDDRHQETALAAPSVPVATATLRALHARWPDAPLILTPATAQAAPDLAGRGRCCVPMPAACTSTSSTRA